MVAAGSWLLFVSADRALVMSHGPSMVTMTAPTRAPTAERLLCLACRRRGHGGHCGGGCAVGAALGGSARPVVLSRDLAPRHELRPWRSPCGGRGRGSPPCVGLGGRRRRDPPGEHPASPRKCHRRPGGHRVDRMVGRSNTAALFLRMGRTVQLTGLRPTAMMRPPERPGKRTRCLPREDPQRVEPLGGSARAPGDVRVVRRAPAAQVSSPKWTVPRPARRGVSICP